MDVTTAKKIGSIQALKATFAGLLIAYAIMAYFNYPSNGLLYALTWIKDVSYAFNLVVGVIAITIAAWFFGQKAGVAILINHKNKYWIGILYGFAVLWSATLIGSAVGFMQEGIDNIGTDDDPFFDYFWKPFFWITFFGWIPVTVVGIWFGASIYKRRVPGS